MNADELSDLTHLAVSNISANRLDEIYKSMTYKDKAELVNAIANYAVLGHTKDEVQTKSERLLAAVIRPVFIYEEAKIMEGMK